MRFQTVLVLALVAAAAADPLYGASVEAGGARDVSERDAEYWMSAGQRGVWERAALAGEAGRGYGPARRVVMFLGDGMSVPTLAAARTLLGQRKGETGEEDSLSFEHFPTVGLSKTYCLDGQVADSACTASAYLCGVKANVGTIGVSGHVERYECPAATEPAHQLASLAAWALSAGRDAGVVTTTRVTHASPAGVYAHTADRDWESDTDLPHTCTQPDIAQQLIHSYPGNELKVILGGGRREFLPNTVTDEEGGRGRRGDGRNLIEEWKSLKEGRGASHQYVWNREQLMEAVEQQPEYLLGLFESSHMQYHLQANTSTEPTLAELTEVAIRALGRNERGFFLFVEGGRIDHAHHENQAQLALDETIELSAAVQRARDLLDEHDSLVVVTSDHAHVMSLSGYTHRGSDILGPSDSLGDDALPYTTLSYGNGPGYRPPEGDHRADTTHDDYRSVEYRYPAMVPLESETHGGDDVAVFAWGAHHHLFSGLYEQNHIPHRIGYAACIGPGAHVHETRS